MKFDNPPLDRNPRPRACMQPCSSLAVRQFQRDLIAPPGGK